MTISGRSPRGPCGPFTDVRGLREAFLRAVDDTLGPTRPRALEALNEVGLTPSSSIPC